MLNTGAGGLLVARLGIPAVGGSVQGERASHLQPSAENIKPLLRYWQTCQKAA